jgi:hypothetical protein
MELKISQSSDERNALKVIRKRPSGPSGKLVEQLGVDGITRGLLRKSFSTSIALPSAYVQRSQSLS